VSPSDNETWLIEAGDAVIQRKARDGIGRLSPTDKLIYCLWVADYGMRNAGDLATASDLYANFQTDGLRAAQEIGLPASCAAFALPTPDLQNQYFERFESICDEIRRVLSL
jgi:hypothetical protein